jgi:tripartite ATP-independent transporter DctP family solute receptor
MRRRKILALLIAIIMVASLMAGCSRPSENGGAASNEGTTGTAGSGDVITIKFAHTDTEQRTSHIAAVHFKEYMEKNTNGRVAVEIYPNGQLGDDQEILKGVQLNTIQMWYGSSSALSALIGPEGDIFNLPYMFKSFDHLFTAIDECGGYDLYNEVVQKYGYYCLGLEYDGARSIINSVKPVNTIEDMKGLKIRATPSEILIRTLELMGANPVPMSWSEVYTGLQQGSIDGMDQGVAMIVDQKFYEVSKYFSATDHLVQTASVITSQKFLDSLPEDIKAVLLEGGKILAEEQRQLEYEKAEESIQILKDNGVAVNTITDAERERFTQAVSPIYDEYRDKIGADLMDQVFKMADEAAAKL